MTEDESVLGSENIRFTSRLHLRPLEGTNVVFSSRFAILFLAKSSFLAFSLQSTLGQLSFSFTQKN